MQKITWTETKPKIFRKLESSENALNVNHLGLAHQLISNAVKHSDIGNLAALNDLLRKMRMELLKRIK